MVRRNGTTTEQKKVDTNALSAPVFVTQHSPVEQLPFPDHSALPDEAPQVPQQPFPSWSGTPDVTQSLPDPVVSFQGTQALTNLAVLPSVTRQLADPQTSTLPTLTKSNTTALRQPVLIRGTGKKREEPGRSPSRRRLVVHLAVTSLLAFMVLGALIAVVPTGSEAHGGAFNILQPIMKLVNTRSNNTGLLIAQQATATAVTQDGFDPGAQTYAGLPAAPPGSSTGGAGRFFYGQCTDWANRRYHALTGIWVPWLGNANQWTSGAINSGWVVSGTPKVPSIIVLQAGVQGAGYYGHVAIVEKINADGSVLTSNYNWAGNWAVETFVTFHPGSGVSFVWAPGH
ncbi:MAG TPA: CHAP domain-containing protein [Ktedonobacteraceae bacterium]|nr:CHAP domain-containing protein [Ktedonobacteraceae bacterium]